MSGNRGIYRVGRTELNDFADGRSSSVTSISYGVTDGMKTGETNGGGQPAGLKSRDGRLWFPTIKGVVSIDPENLNQLPPTVLIEQVLVGKTPFDPRAAIRIRAGQSDLEIHYTGLSLSAAEKVRFRYKLEGYNEDWVDAGSRRVAYFTNIAPGSYTFRVMAANNDGVWTTVDATAQIIVIPPFWKTWWFTFLVVSAAAAALLLLYRRRIAQLNGARMAQEAFSRQLIESQESERQRIAGELHDSLGQELLIIKNRAVLGLKLPDEETRAREQIEQIAETASEAITEVRQIAYNLRPYHLDEIGLTQSLEELVERVSTACPIKFTSSIEYIDDICPKASTINLYRIVQEGINNIVKHSEASEAGLVIRRNSRAIEVAIKDNGKGFHVAGATRRTQHGFGLTGLAERARILGGTLAVHSTPGKGTILTLTIRSQDVNHEV
jgi:signal transduction histidine kinase